MIARAEYPCPTTAELCGVFAQPQLLPEGMLCPVSLCDGKTVAKGVIPVVALGFSIADGKLSQLENYPAIYNFFCPKRENTRNSSSCCIVSQKIVLKFCSI